MGLYPNGSIGFGVDSVSGLILVPSPPQRMTAFVDSLANLSFIASVIKLDFFLSGTVLHSCLQSSGVNSIDVLCFILMHIAICTYKAYPKAPI